MKYLFLIFVLVGLGTAAASDLGFVLSNESGRSFEAVYITASSNKDWDGNLLPNGRLLTEGSRLRIVFPEGTKAPAWDINVVDDTGLSVTFKSVDLANVERITLKDEAGKIAAVIE